MPLAPFLPRAELPLRRMVSTAVAAVSRALFPPVCPVCAAPMEGEGAWGICAGCAAGLAPIGPHACRRCALPIDGELAGAGILECGYCRTDPPPFDAAVAALRYQGKGREMIHRFKFNGKGRLAHTLGPMLCAALHRAGAAEGMALVVPVPLHRSRLFGRGFNQSWLLASAIGGAFNIPVAAALSRARHTPPQFALSKAKRRENIKGAFMLEPGVGVRGKGVLLVDDIMTTGATLAEAAKTLKKAGAAKVVCAVAARVE